METVIIALLALLLAAATVILIKLFSKSGGEASVKMDIIGDRLDRLAGSSEQSQALLRKELSDSSLNLSATLTERQKLSDQSLDNRLKAMEERLHNIERSNQNSIALMQEAVTRQLTDIKDDNSKRLEQIRVTVDEKLQTTLEEKMNRSFKTVSEQLEQVYKGLGEMQSLASGVGDLKKVLSNVKNRGILGEMQLGAILSEILAPEQYATNVETVPASGNRVEFAIKLPGEGEGTVWLPIDSKFPGDTYSALQSAYDSGDKEAVDAAFKELTVRIKASAKDIRDKYVKPPYTTNFGIMFLPFEGLYAEVVNHGLVEELQRLYQVNVAGPSTMAALLNSLYMGFRTLAIQKRSDEVWRVLAKVKSEFDKFEDVLTKTQRHMKQVEDDLTTLVGTRTNTIQRALRDVERLDDQEDGKPSLPPPDGGF